MAKQKTDSERVVLQMKEQYEAMLSEGKALNARFHVSHEENASLRKECMEFKSARSEMNCSSSEEKDRETERLREAQNRERDAFAAAKACEERARLEVEAARHAAQANEERVRSECMNAHSAALLSEERVKLVCEASIERMRSEFNAELDKRSVGGVSPAGAAPPGFGNVERVYPADDAKSEECSRLHSEIVEMKAAQSKWYEDVRNEMARLDESSKAIVRDSIAQESSILEQRHAAEKEKLNRECIETRELCQNLLANEKGAKGSTQPG